MPSNWLYIDTNFPTFTGGESTEEKIGTIQNYMYMLVEQLRYSLRNLDLGNMNQAAVREYEAYLTEPIYARIEGAEGDVTQLQVTARGLAGRISDAEGNITALAATAQGLSAQISNAQGEITSLQATAQGLSSSISNMDGEITALQQTVDSFSLTVSNQESSSRLSLTANGFEVASATIRFTGDVVFESRLRDGYTVVSGNCIRTGEISANYIRLGGELTVYEEIDSPYIGGKMGYVFSRDYNGNTTGGMGMINWDRRFQIVVTDGGARMTSPWSEIVSAINITLDTDNRINASTEITVTSDRRLKEDIRYDVGQGYLGLFDLVEPASFFYKKGLRERHLGFIAQDVMAGLEALGAAEMALVSCREDGFYGLAAGELLPILWAKVKALDKKVKEMAE